MSPLQGESSLCSQGEILQTGLPALRLVKAGSKYITYPTEAILQGCGTNYKGTTWYGLLRKCAFEVQCKLTGACYAAKKFRNDLVEEKDFDKKFHTEFTLLHQLEHKNIVCYVGYTIF